MVIGVSERHQEGINHKYEINMKEILDKAKLVYD